MYATSLTRSSLGRVNASFLVFVRIIGAHDRPNGREENYDLLSALSRNNIPTCSTRGLVSWNRHSSDRSSSSRTKAWILGSSASAVFVFNISQGGLKTWPNFGHLVCASPEWEYWVQFFLCLAFRREVENEVMSDLTSSDSLIYSNSPSSMLSSSESWKVCNATCERESLSLC